MRIREVGEDEERAEEEPKAAMVVKRAVVGAGARILFYPTLLYNLIRHRIEPAGFRWWDQVDQFLLLGAVPFPGHVPLLRQIGVRAVVTLNEPYETLVPSSLYKEYDINHLQIPTRDYLFAPSPEDISRAVDFIHMNSSLGRTTYVHCKAGRGRSTTVVLCYLVKHRNMTPDDALEYVRSRRPRVLLAPSQWRAVAAYSRTCVDCLPVPATPREPCLLTWGNESSLISSDTEDYSSEELFSQDLALSFYQISDQMSSSPTRSHDDEVIVTEKDLEGYETFQGNCRAVVVHSSCAPPRPIMKKLSCLFGALKLSSCEPARPNRVAEVRAC